jgi:Na+-driven multidrug efflux pump
MRGLEAVEATSISSTIVNVFNVAMLATGSTVGIVIGRILGSGDMKKARDYDNKLIAFSVAVSTVAGVFLFLASSIATLPYNVSDETARIATELMRVSAILMPIHGFVHASYFTLRSGGKTLSTFLFDSGFVWTVAVPLGFVIGKFTNVPIVAFTFICQAIDIIKCVVGFILVKGGSWLNNIVSK